MKEFMNIFVDVWKGSVDLWKNDRKEFWDMYLSFALVTFWLWLTIFVLLPLFNGL